MLVRLLYASRAVDTTPAAIEAICASARQHNAEQGVTGVLVYGGGIFMKPSRAAARRSATCTA